MGEREVGIWEVRLDEEVIGLLTVQADDQDRDGWTSSTFQRLPAYAVVERLEDQGEALARGDKTIDEDVWADEYWSMGGALNLRDPNGVVYRDAVVLVENDQALFRTSRAGLHSQ